MKEKSEKIYACFEHVDLALDDYVNFQEAAPQIITFKEEEKCSYCTNKAEYIIMK